MVKVIGLAQDVEVSVNVDLDDVYQEFSERVHDLDLMSSHLEVLRVVNQFAGLLKCVGDDQISKLNDKQRCAVKDFLLNQAARYG